MTDTDLHKSLFGVLKVLPTDYTNYGGEVERWKDNSDYPDCSCGCRWFVPLEAELGNDWGVCGNPNSPRAGLLTFEHQTGRGCFEQGMYYDVDETEELIQEMVDEWKWDNN